ncbi:hypothetical protein Hanom_Chr06g00502151 [Helianthus anomalus]
MLLKAQKLHGGWKPSVCFGHLRIQLYLVEQIKQDNEDCRVMYKEGSAGTPFHNLLVEGYVDGPLDVCKFD